MARAGNVRGTSGWRLNITCEYRLSGTDSAVDSEEWWPQGSVLSPMLLNNYISDLPETTSRKYGYADDLAILLRRASGKATVDYLRKWRLQLSIGKTVSAAKIKGGSNRSV